jgi:uncharacterized membrane protein
MLSWQIVSGGKHRRKGGGMTKADFLNALRGKLTGEVPPSEIEHTVRYYDEYISEAVNSGKSEAQVLEELGSPLLIAKTIIDTSTMHEEAGGRKTREENWKTEEPSGAKFHQVKINSWTAKLLLVLAVIVVCSLVFTVLRILIPILLPLLLLWLLVTIIRNGGRR